VHYRLGDLLQRARDFDEAIASERVALALSPQYNGAHNIISICLLAKGAAAGALVEAEADRPRHGGRSASGAYYAVGQGESDAALSALIAKLERTLVQHRL
jgi:hypothetical protein